MKCIKRKMLDYILHCKYLRCQALENEGRSVILDHVKYFWRKSDDERAMKINNLI